MALHEGCRRIRTAARGLMFAGVMGIGTVLVLARGLRALHDRRLIPLLLAAFLLCELAGGGLRFLAWILEGFALPSSASPTERLSR